jgi:hypothetical protein
MTTIESLFENRYAALNMCQDDEKSHETDSQYSNPSTSDQPMDAGQTLNHVNDGYVEQISFRLSDCPARKIRKKYTEYLAKYRDQFDSGLMQRLWDGWLLSIPQFPGPYNLGLANIRKFVLYPDQHELILYDKSPRQRYRYHLICHALKLEHRTTDENEWEVVSHTKHVRYPAAPGTQETKSLNKNSKYNKKQIPDRMLDQDKLKTMIIIKPYKWNWEFTKISPEQKKYDREKMKEQEDKRIQWIEFMKTKQCAGCRVTAAQSELLIAESIQGLYCTGCVARKELGLSGHVFKHAIGGPGRASRP